MMSLTELPSEILSSICFHADRRSRKALGSTCWLLRDVCKQWIFHSIGVSSTSWSCERFENLLAAPHLSQYVTKICLDTDIWRLQDDQSGDQEVHNMDNITSKRSLVWINRLQELPKLRSVTFLAQSRCPYGRTLAIGSELELLNMCYSTIMEAFISSLLSLPQPLHELAIINLRCMDRADPTTIRAIKNVLRTLRSLHLNILVDYKFNIYDNNEPDIKQASTFFGDLPSLYLQPAASNLEHLTLYSNVPFGFYPRLDLGEVHFPKLKSLSFGNYTFVHDSQLDWILSHGATLTKLYLDSCPILFEVAMKETRNTYLKANEFETTSRPELSGVPYASYQTRWCDYFRAFKDRLPHLRHFLYGQDPASKSNAFVPIEDETNIKIGLTEKSYRAHFDTIGLISSIYEIEIEPDEGTLGCYTGPTLSPSQEDKEALRELYAKLRQDVGVLS